MLHVDNEKIRSLLLEGRFGLEKESLRIDGEGFLAHTVHPFSGETHIVRDFCENQTEINTPAAGSAAEAGGLCSIAVVLNIVWFFMVETALDKTCVLVYNKIK